MQHGPLLVVKVKCSCPLQVSTSDFGRDEEFRGELMVPYLSKIFIENSHQNMTIRAIFKDKDVMFTETDKED